MPFVQSTRREFMALVGGAAAWPLAARAEQRSELRRIGVLVLGSESDPIRKIWVSTLREGLQRLGWFDDRNLRIELRFAGDDPSTIQACAEELVNLAPDLLVVHSSTGTSAVRQRTKTIPIVFVAVGDPIANGIVDNIARPEGNVTGFTNLMPSIGGKWLELLKQAAPRIARVGLVFNPELQFSHTYFASIEETAPALAVQLIRVPYRNPAELVSAADAIATEPNGGLIVLPPIGVYPAEFISRLERNQVPAIGNVKSFATAGGLMSYGADNADLFRRATTYVDRILRGDKPSDLPVQFPTKFEMVVNLKAARGLGLAIPWTLSALATEVID